MKLRTLLLGTTSLCLLSIFPFAASAQDGGLTAAYNAYVAASSGDDAEARAAAEAAFLAECQRVGAPDLNACVAIATGAATTEEPAEEPPPPAEEPPPPAEEPVEELTPPPEPPPAEQPVSEQPVEETVPEQPVTEQPQPEQPAEQEPVPEQPVEEQPVEEQPVEEQPAEELVPEQPTETSPAEDPALIAAFEAYVSARTGADEAATANAEAAFLAECNRLGIASLEECLAVMGGGAVTPSTEPPTEQPPAELPTEQPTTPPDGETPPVAAEPVEETIPNIETPDAPIAPVLDSLKEDEGQPPPDQPVEPSPGVTPTTDEEAQTAPPVAPEDVEATLTAEGTRIEQLPMELPPDVEVVNQTDDNRFFIDIGINVVIYTPYKDRDRISRDAREVYYEELRNGRVRQTVVRNDGTEIITVWNRFGEIERRIKVRPDGTRVVLVYFDRDDRRNWRDPGDDLPPFRLNIPVNEYVIYSQEADEDELVAFLDQPPLEPAARVYSVDEVKYSARIRDTVRKVDIGDITFETDSAEVDREQVGSLTKVAQAMARIIEDDPSEVFLIEGHTDAVGSEAHNLALSDRRAETIANLLTDLYNIPPENLTTQGYGEEYLKVLTEGPERANRRATVRRITPLVSSAGNA